MTLKNEGGCSVTHKDITTLLAGDSKNFVKLTLWEFIRDLFPNSHIKEAKKEIANFVTLADNKNDMFNRIKSLANPEEQWRFNATTEFSLDENKDIIVSRAFSINIGSLANNNDAEKNKVFSLFSEQLNLESYQSDINFDEKAFQKGLLKIQFPNDNEKLNVYVKNQIPFKNITIDLSTLEKHVLMSLKQFTFENVKFTGKVYYENLNGPVFDNCLFQNCNFENVSLVSSGYSLKRNDEIPIYGVFKECFLYGCEIKNFKIDTSKIFSVNQEPNEGKVGAYLFMHSFVYDCSLKKGECQNASVIASTFLGCDIAQLNGVRMDFIGTSFYEKKAGASRRDNLFYDCDFSCADMTYKRYGIREDLLGFDPGKFFKNSECKFNLNDYLPCYVYDYIFLNKGNNHKENDIYISINKYLKISNCNLYNTSLGEKIDGITLSECAISTSTTWLCDDRATKTQSCIPVYMDMKGAVDKNEIASFIDNVIKTNLKIKEYNDYVNNVVNDHIKQLLSLQALLGKLNQIMTINGDSVKYHEFNNETIGYLVYNIIYNKGKDITSEIDINKLDFLHDLYTYNSFSRRSSSRFHFEFNQLKDLMYRSEVLSISDIQDGLLGVKKFKEENEKSYKKEYKENSNIVDDKVAIFVDIEKYLREKIEEYYGYIRDNYVIKKQKLVNLYSERSCLVKKKEDLVNESLKIKGVNKNGKNNARTEINKIKKINEINEINEKKELLDEEIRVLNSENENFEQKYEKSELNELINDIKTWLYENKTIVETLKIIDTK